VHVPEGTESNMHETAKEWTVIKPVVYQTNSQKLVVCLDTMGQDREFTDD